MLHFQEPPASVPVWGWRACSKRIEGDVGRESGGAEKDLEKRKGVVGIGCGKKEGGGNKGKTMGNKGKREGKMGRRKKR